MPNYGLLDPEIMKVLAKDDPGNQFGIPWTGTDAGMNVEKVKAALGNDAPLDSWALLFDPKYAQKLKHQASRCSIRRSMRSGWRSST